jgi:hypothetical protein
VTLSIVEATAPIVSVRISGELGNSEVSQIQALAVEAIRRYGKVSALLILDDFRGWKRRGDWGDVTFLAEQDKKIAKIAVVGDEQWRDLVCAFLAKGFRQAAVEYFLPADLGKAHAWLEVDNP